MYRKVTPIVMMKIILDNDLHHVEIIANYLFLKMKKQVTSF